MGEKVYIVMMFIGALAFSYYMGCLCTQYKTQQVLCTILTRDDSLHASCVEQPTEYVYADLMYKVNVKEECK